jgi:hypothetical protein
MGRGFKLLLFLTCTVVVRASGLMTGDIRAGFPMECDAGDAAGTNVSVKVNGMFNIHGKEVTIDKFRDVAPLLRSS